MSKIDKLSLEKMRDMGEISDNLYAENENLKKENEKLKKVIDEADDLIKSHLTNHYKTQWKHICEYYGVDIE